MKKMPAVSSDAKFGCKTGWPVMFHPISGCGWCLRQRKIIVVRAGCAGITLGKPLADGSLPPEGCKDWQIHLITPGEHPLEAVAVSLTYAEDSLLQPQNYRTTCLQEARSLAWQFAASHRENSQT